MVEKNLLFTGITFKALAGIILIIGGVISHPIMYVAALYVTIAVVMEKDFKNVLYLMYAWLSVSVIFKFNADSTSFFTILEIIVVLKWIIINRKIKYEKGFLVCFTVFCIYLIFGMGTNYKDVIKAICVPPLIYVSLKDLRYEDLKICSAYHIAGVILNCIIGLMRSSIPNMETYVTFKQQKMGEYFVDRFSGLNGDPNYFSLDLILVITIISVWFSRNEIKVHLFYILYTVMVAFGSLTGSKSFLIMLVMTTLYTIFLQTKCGRPEHSIFFVLVIAVSLLFLVTDYGDFLTRVLYRVENVSDRGFDTGRSQIWKDYFELYSADLMLLLFGSGLGRDFLLDWVPHNFYIDIFVLFGIIGGCIYFLTIYYSVKKHASTHFSGSLFPLMALAAMYCFLTMFNEVSLPFHIILVFGFFYLTPRNSLPQKWFNRAKRKVDTNTPDMFIN